MGGVTFIAEYFSSTYSFSVRKLRCKYRPALSPKAVEEAETKNSENSVLKKESGVAYVLQM